MTDIEAFAEMKDFMKYFKERKRFVDWAERLLRVIGKSRTPMPVECIFQYDRVSQMISFFSTHDTTAVYKYSEPVDMDNEKFFEITLDGLQTRMEISHNIKLTFTIRF